MQVIAYSKGSRDPDAVDKWTVFFDPAINAALGEQAGAAKFINPLIYLCEGPMCPYREKGQYLYEDAEHFSVLGSEQAVVAYFPLLGAAGGSASAGLNAMQTASSIGAP